MRSVHAAFFLAVVLGLSSCATVRHKSALPALERGGHWKLLFQDEFDGKELDSAKWNVLGDHARRDGFWLKKDAYLDAKGHLVIRTSYDGEKYGSGAVNTSKKFEHAYGYYEARCKLPKEVGHWGAFWLMGSMGTTENGGRDGAEIDIMEYPWRDGKIQQTIHWDGYKEAHKMEGFQPVVPGVTEGFHTFGLWWTPEEYVFYVDGQETWRTSAGGVCELPRYIKLTDEVGEWGGDIKEAALPDYFIVDYVRVYEIGEGNEGHGR